MKNVNIFSAILLLAMTGCGGNKQSDNEFITVDVTASYPKKELILQDFMDVEYIPLETGGEFYCQGCGKGYRQGNYAGNEYYQRRGYFCI